MFWKFLFGENWIGWGWLSLIMSIPYGLLNLFFEFDWDWMVGVPFGLFYFWAVLGFPFILIFIFLHCVVMVREGFQKRTISSTNMILLVVSASIFGFGTRHYWKNLFGL